MKVKDICPINQILAHNEETKRKDLTAVSVNLPFCNGGIPRGKIKDGKNRNAPKPNFHSLSEVRKTD